VSNSDHNEEVRASLSPDARLYDEDGVVRGDYIAHVGAAIADRDVLTLRREVAEFHESELADLLEALLPDQRLAFAKLLGKEFDLAALTDVDEAIRLEIVDAMENEDIAVAVQDMDLNDAVYILEDLDEEDQEEILSRLPHEERILIQRALTYPEESAGRRMQNEFVAVPSFWTVGQTIDYLRDEKELPDRFNQIYVVDPHFKLSGAVDLDQVLRTKRTVKMETIKHETRHAIPVNMDQEEAAQIMQQYDLLSAAVVDENDRLVGVLAIDDVIDVIQEEAEEDILRLAGVGDEELSDNVIETAKSRWPWLFVNTLTALIASTVIGFFDATIEQMVALAVLMPIVASMGGNAGTQTMTVTVRALATKDLDIYNAARVIRREALIGLSNGLIFALVVGSVAALWFGNPNLGLVIGMALIVNLMAAAMAGILIPLLLQKAGADPALASGVFVTMVTDVVGFMSFLGFAAWWFRLAI
jgi:magnesium transporter